MKKFMMISASLSVIAFPGLVHASDFKTLTTTSTSAQVSQEAPVKKSGFLKGGARVVPDTTPASDAGAKQTFKKADQGYSNMSAYNVVNDQNKPITNDWTRPKNWRIGYKNKNRTPINE